jgi:AcrR family transcriptional regulator
VGDTMDVGQVATSLIDAARSRRTPAAQRVTDAGIDLFARVGFLATTIRDLTRSCGITAPSFYNHFDSKEALLFEIVRDANSELDRLFNASPIDELSPADGLAALVRTLVTFNLVHPREARIANREWVFLQPPAREEVTNHRRRVRALFERALSGPDVARGLVSGVKGPQADALEERLLAISIVNMSIASSEWYHPDGALSVTGVAECYANLALRMAGLDMRAGHSVHGNAATH